MTYLYVLTCIPQSAYQSYTTSLSKENLLGCFQQTLFIECQALERVQEVEGGVRVTQLTHHHHQPGQQLGQHRVVLYVHRSLLG